MNPEGSAATAGASTFEGARARLIVLRAVTTIAALACFQLFGAAEHLRAGLEARFDGAWFPVHAIYFLVALSGVGALMIPFSLYENFVLDARETGESTDVDGWTAEILKAFVIDMAVGTAFFLALYGLIAGLPRAWSIAAALLYTIVSGILSLAPMLQGPPEDELAELRDPELRERISTVLKQLHQPEFDVLRWHGEGSRNQSLLALHGIGKRRRIIISDSMHRNFSADEIAALLAHEASHIRDADLIRFNLVNLAAALVVFVSAHAMCVVASQSGLPAPENLGAFPLLTGSLLTMSFIAMPLLNAYTRRREYVADAISARVAGEIPLRTAIEKLNAGGPAPAAPHPLDILLNAQPAHHHRLWRLNQKP